MHFGRWGILVGLSASCSANVDSRTKLLTARAVQSTSCCCDALKDVLGDKVLFPADAAYNASLKSYWSLQETNVHPYCIVSPGSAQDVSQAVHTMVVGNTKWPGQCQFAIRGGGHTAFAGSANIKDGITLDLSKLQATGLSADHKIIQISPGARWSDVYATLDPHNLSTSGGRVSTVGVGGLTTGGGISFYSPRFGFVCNNVQNFEVVMGDGSIVNANATDRPDLFKALRGGSNNFGVVTSFDMKVFPQGPFWGGFFVNPVSTRQQQFAALEKFTANPHYDPYSAVINSYSINSVNKTWFISNYLTYTADSPPQPYPPVLRPFTSIRPTELNTLRVAHLGNFTAELAERSPNGIRDLFMTSTFANSAAMMSAYFDLANDTAQPLLGVPGFQLSITFQPMPTIITSKSAHQGPGDSLGLDPAQIGNVINLDCTIMWDRAEDDERIEAATREFFAKGEAVSKRLGVYRKYLYLNYANVGQRPIEGYGNASVQRLIATSKKYDPNGVFQNQVPGGFKLPMS